MKKIICFFISIIALLHYGNAQTEFGISAGISSALVNAKEDGVTINSDAKIGFAGGITVSSSIADHWSFRPELNFIQTDTATNNAVYLTKNKNQKTAAIVLLSGGGALAIAGTIIALNDLHYIFTPHPKHEATAEALFITGTACMLGSIPLFISAAHNKRKAISVRFKDDYVPQLQNATIINKPLPALSLSVRF